MPTNGGQLIWSQKKKCNYELSVYDDAGHALLTVKLTRMMMPLLTFA